MNSEHFTDFKTSLDTFRVYARNELVFNSQKGRLTPVLEYLEKSPVPDEVVIFDRAVGNAAALLAILAGAGEVVSPLGSQIAAETLNRAGIKWHFDVTVEHIQRPDGRMCPMEQASLGKKPGEFYLSLKETIKR